VVVRIVNDKRTLSFAPTGILMPASCPNLAEGHFGVAVGFLHALEHGERESCLNTLDVLAKSFEWNISELMRGV